MVDVGDLDFSDPGVAFDSAIEFGLRWLDFDDPAAAADPLPGEAPEPLHRFWDAFGGKTVNGRSVIGPGTTIDFLDPSAMRRDRADDTGHDLLVFAAYGGAAMGWATAIGTELADPPMFEDSDQTDGWELVNDSLVRFLTAAVFMNAASLGHTGELPDSYWQGVRDSVENEEPLATFGLYTPQSSDVWVHPDELLVTKDTTFTKEPRWIISARTAETITALETEYGRAPYSRVSVLLGYRTDEQTSGKWRANFFPDGSATLTVTQATTMQLEPGTFDFDDIVTQAVAIRDTQERALEERKGKRPSISLFIANVGRGTYITDDAAKSLGDLVLDRIERSPEFNENWETARPEIYR